MALYKEIEESNGIVTKYHRIASLNIVTNVQNTIEIASYTSEAKRQEEIEAIKNKTGCNVFRKTTRLCTEYDQDMTIQNAYEWLKTLSQFDGAEDI